MVKVGSCENLLYVCGASVSFYSTYEVYDSMIISEHREKL